MGIEEIAATKLEKQILLIFSFFIKIITFWITPERIIETCAKFYDVKKDDIYSNKRTKEIALARQVAMYIMRELTDLRLSKTT